MFSERASQQAFFAVSALLFAASAAVAIVWCAPMSTMGEMPMPGGWTMSMAWMRMPAELKTLGAMVLLISLYIAFLTMRENPYSSPVVRVQKERAQTVISTGPYRYVRHPMYTGACLFFLGTALLLGSWYGVLCTPVFIVLFELLANMVNRQVSSI
jgi:protein-S-isoprenylcysteine O-methyltransferase Ste14